VVVFSHRFSHLSPNTFETEWTQDAAATVEERPFGAGFVTPPRMGLLARWRHWGGYAALKAPLFHGADEVLLRPT